MKEQIHKELAVLQNELSRLDTAVKHIEEAKKLSQSITSIGQKLNSKYEEQLKEVNNLLIQYQGLATKTEELVEKIDKVDFPLRFEKLDIAVTTLNQGMQNTQMKIENLGRDLKDNLTIIKDDFLKKFEKNKKELTTLKVLAFIITGLVIGILIIVLANY